MSSIFLKLLFSVVFVIGLASSVFSVTPNFPGEFTTCINITLPHAPHPVIYRIFYDASKIRHRLESWGIDTPSSVLNSNAIVQTVGDDVCTKFGPPLYTYIFLYEKKEIHALLPGAHGLDCLIEKLEGPMEPPGPDFTNAVYQGQVQKHGQLCDEWTGSDNIFSNYTFYSSVADSSPVEMITANWTKRFDAFNNTRPDDSFFESPVPCHRSSRFEAQANDKNHYRSQAPSEVQQQRAQEKQHADTEISVNSEDSVEEVKSRSSQMKQEGFARRVLKELQQQTKLW